MFHQGGSCHEEADRLLRQQVLTLEFVLGTEVMGTEEEGTSVSFTVQGGAQEAPQSRSCLLLA